MNCIAFMSISDYSVNSSSSRSKSYYSSDLISDQCVSVSASFLSAFTIGTIAWKVLTFSFKVTATGLSGRFFSILIVVFANF